MVVVLEEPELLAMNVLYMMKENNMKTTRTYLQGCTWCKSVGLIMNPSLTYSSALTITCPVCNGAKTIVITEVTEMPDVSVKTDC